jgi:DnaK suppressor protein
MGTDEERRKTQLVAEREALLALAATSDAAAQPVELDQARVGRLSRMDAMQAQAMSIEARRRREIQLTRIESALSRIDSGDYGHCIRCGEPIDDKRLDFDPAVLLCIECATESER